MFLQSKNISFVIIFAYFIMGFILTFLNLNIELISLFIGIGLIIMGIILTTIYVVLDVSKKINRNDLTIGVIFMAAGLIIILQKTLVALLVPIILGFLILLSGLWKMQRGIIIYHLRIDLSYTYLVLAFASMVIGLISIFFLSFNQLQHSSFVIIGLGYIYCAITDGYAILFLEKKFQHVLKEKGLN